MCTIIAKKIKKRWVLGKTRDPVPTMRWDDELKLFDSTQDRYRKLIVQNPDQNEDGYYGGINDQGVAMVATYVGVAEDQVSYTRRPYVRLILDACSSQEAVGIIQAFNPRIGGNILVADAKDCYVIEGTPEEYAIKKAVNTGIVKTNHFQLLKRRNLRFDRVQGYAKWSTCREERAQELLPDLQSIDDVKELLKDRKNKGQKVPICATYKERECFTHSAMVFDTGKRVAHYAQGNPLKTPFEEFGF